MSVVAYDKLVKSSESDTNKILPCMLVILTKQLNYYLAQGKRDIFNRSIVHTCDLFWEEFLSRLR